VKVGDLVMLRHGDGYSGSTSMIGIILEIHGGSFARIGQSYSDKRARVMWNRQPHHIFSYPRSVFSYETLDVLVRLDDEGR